MPWSRQAGSLSIALATVLAAFLRADQLAYQVLVADEWHSVDHALQIGYWATTVAYWILEHTTGLWDWMIRGFYLLLGVLLTLALPLVVARRFGEGTGATYAWLLAISPFLVYYSRFARPYALVGVLSLAALWLFDHWRQSGRRDLGVLYALALAATLSLNVLHAPFVLSPFLYALLRPRSARRLEFRNLFILGGLSALFCALVLALPLAYSLSFILETADDGSRELQTLYKVAQVFLGTTDFWPTLALGALAGWGLLSGVLRRSPLVEMLVFASAVQVGVVFFLAPVGAGAPHIFSRYAMPVLFVVLFLAAVGISRLTEAVGRAVGRGEMLVWGLVPGALLLYLFAAGPLRSSYLRPNNWFPDDLQWRLAGEEDFYRDAIQPVSQFYRELGERPPGSVTLIEVPWDANTNRNPYPYYQVIHRQKVLVAYPGKGWSYRWQRGETGFKSHLFVPLDEPEEVKRRGDFLVMHKRLQDEMRPLTVPQRKEEVEARQTVLEFFLRKAQTHLGPPVFEDEQVLVFALD